MVSSTPRTALVQGASRGLGLAFVEALLASPGVGQVLATARDPEASRLADLRAAQPDRLVTLPLDVTQEDTIARAAAAELTLANRPSAKLRRFIRRKTQPVSRIVRSRLLRRR